MNIKSHHVFTSKNLDAFDITISLAYRDFKIWKFKPANIKKADIIRAVIYTNKVVSDFLRGV